MRQRLDTTPSPGSANSTVGGAARSARRSRRTPVLLNTPITLGTVPLAPWQITPPLMTPRLAESADSTANPQSAPLDAGTVPLHTIRLLVQETLRQMGVERVDISGSPPSNASRRARPPSKPAVKAQQMKMSNEDDKAWKVSFLPA
jgi:hypothetical protein